MHCINSVDYIHTNWDFELFWHYLVNNTRYYSRKYAHKNKTNREGCNTHRPTLSCTKQYVIDAQLQKLDPLQIFKLLLTIACGHAVNKLLSLGSNHHEIGLF